MTTYKHSAEIVATLTYEEGILVCGAKGCPSAINVDTGQPAPARLGWELRNGWWLCPGCL